jgi:hypothetical protein
MFKESAMNSPSAMTAYICPMHSQVRQSTPGKCPTCGMPLVQENARFAFLQHMLGKPFHLALMVAVMITLMAAAMMLMR